MRWVSNPFLGLWALPGNCFTTAGAQLHSRGLWFEEQFTHAALGRIFYQMCSYLQPPRRGCGINGVALPNLNPNFAHEEVYTEWASARSRQTTTPTPRRSVFTGRTLFLTPSQQYPSTEGTTKQTRKLNRKSIRHGQQKKQLSEFLTKLEQRGNC